MFMVNAGAKYRPDGDLGTGVAEPYDTSIIVAHPWQGLMVHADASFALATDHWRVLAEGAYRRDGDPLPMISGGPTPVGNQSGTMGYFTFGYTPDGHYGAASKNAPLKKGWEIITRLEGINLTVPSGDGQNVNWLAATTGVNWQVYKQLRLQTDLGWEQFSVGAAPPNSGRQRIYGQLWMTYRL
jgi:hypothetical protein